MTREFVITNEFDRQWKSLGLTDDDLSELQIFLCKNPDFGDIMQGTGGVRKIRWAAKGKGKSGGVRIIYLDVIFVKHIHLLTVFPKNVKENLNNEERNKMKKVATAIKKTEGEIYEK